MPPFSPITSFSLRTGMLLALLAVAWCWMPVPVAPVVNAPRPETVEPPKPAVRFATSEEAIEFALERLETEQQEDGSWRSNSWKETETTAIVLFAFQQMGQTHRTGKYRKTVEQGTIFLITAAKQQGAAPSKRLVFAVHDSSKRSQALATLAISKLYSMTHDDQLGIVAQQAVNELCLPAHRPQIDVTDSDVVFWQLLALIEAHMAYLTVPIDVAADLQKWYAARIQSLAASRWRGKEFVGIRRFRLLSDAEFKDRFQTLADRPYDQQPALEQFALATAFVDANNAEAVERLPQLQSVVLAQISRDGDLSEVALQLLILRSRIDRLPPSKSFSEDDFPL